MAGDRCRGENIIEVYAGNARKTRTGGEWIERIGWSASLSDGDFLHDKHIDDFDPGDRDVLDHRHSSNGGSDER